MSGPYGPNDAPGPGEGRNDPTQHWGGQQAPGGAGPTQQWGGQQPSPAQPTQQWGGGEQAAQQQWGQQPNQPQQPNQQWGQQPQQPNQPNQPQSQPWAQPQQQPQQQQWGQPQQPQQQWGQQQPQQDWGQQGQQQWNPNQPQPSGSGGGGSKKGLIIGLAVLGVAIVGGIVALILLLTAKDELDQAAVQSGVEKVLSESYDIKDVSDVSCPAGQEVKVDATFTCDLKVSGEAKKVSVKITKDDGTYEVGRPN
ncbi:DUF4333 domain-containing protein [Nocardia cyriacigeorgica]|uniref:DUF4333 domain-containing protein n=1 Tax=Nocardia cyriacigeorgica TaxID=135487 RepID=UPI002456E6F3|nr:DUF4333 domain-containing protein [Nocardia cyriacigeorgica]